jgi:hypothetical protein
MATCDYQVVGFDDDRLTIKFTSGTRTQVLSLAYDGTENIDAFAMRCAPWALFNTPERPPGDNSAVLGKTGTVTQPEPEVPPALDPVPAPAPAA